MSQLKYQSCIAECAVAAVDCINCANLDLNEQDIKMLSRCIRLDLDCAPICFLAMEAMARDSDYAKQICKLCAEICNACAEECEKHTHMAHCRKCAASCRKCAIECNNIVNLIE